MFGKNGPLSSLSSVLQFLWHFPTVQTVATDWSSTIRPGEFTFQSGYSSFVTIQPASMRQAFVKFNSYQFNPHTPFIKPFTSKFKKYILPKKCIIEVVRIGSIIIFRLSKLYKAIQAKFFILCDAIFLVRLKANFEIDQSWE